jgi:ABC-type dipeptide/oligopeptide/nickel transport system ATPase subunit
MLLLEIENLCVSVQTSSLWSWKNHEKMILNNITLSLEAGHSLGIVANQFLQKASLDLSALVQAALHLMA